MMNGFNTPDRDFNSAVAGLPFAPVYLNFGSRASFARI